MARKKAAAEVAKRVFHRSSSNRTLILADSFVYNIEVYKSIPGSYNLEDSKTISSKDYADDEVKVYVQNNARYKRTLELVAAPLDWLTENKFTEQCQDQQEK